MHLFSTFAVLPPTLFRMLINFGADQALFVPFYESQTISSARRLVCIFFKSLSRWRLPCALLWDDDGLAADEELAETKTLPLSAAVSAADLLLPRFGVFFMAPFLKSCNAWHSILLTNHNIIYKTTASFGLLVISEWMPLRKDTKSLVCPKIQNQ